MANAYTPVVKVINQLFGKYGLHYEMRSVRDISYGRIYMIYYLPFTGRAKAVMSSVAPGDCLASFANYYNGADRARVVSLYSEFMNTRF